MLTFLSCPPLPGQEEAKQSSAGSGGKGGSGGGSGKGKGKGKGDRVPPFMDGKFEHSFSFQFDGSQKWGFIPLGIAVAVGYMLTRSDNTRFISWQEFRTQYLERGEVERLQVVNRNVVKVYLRRDNTAAHTTGVSGDSMGWGGNTLAGRGRRWGVATPWQGREGGGEGRWGVATPWQGREGGGEGGGGGGWQHPGRGGRRWGGEVGRGNTPDALGEGGGGILQGWG